MKRIKSQGAGAVVPGRLREPLNDWGRLAPSVCRIPTDHLEETARDVLGDIRGTRKRCLGMAPELLTDARETSYLV